MGDQIKIPFTKALTVVIRKPTGAEEADADLAAVKHGSQVIRDDVSEHYFCRLRLRAAEDPSLLNRIAVFYASELGKLDPIGLTFDDENRWPVGFMQELWEEEVKIDEVHREHARKAIK